MKKYYYFYKLACNDCDCKDVYIGKTTRIANRLRGHKSDCTNINARGYNCKVYKCIRDKGGWDNWLMYILDEGLYSVEESVTIERKYVEKYGTLNHEIPGRTEKEYMRNFQKKNKEKIKDANKLYYQKNKDAINLQHKLHYEKNKDAINLKRRLNRAKK